MLHNFVTIYYNPDNHQHQKALAYLESTGKKVVTVNLMAEPITPTRLQKLALEMGCAVNEMVDQHTETYQQKYKGTALSDSDWLTVLCHNHDMIKLPIVVDNGKAFHVKNPSGVFNLHPVDAK